MTEWWEQPQSDQWYGKRFEYVETLVTTSSGFGDYRIDVDKLDELGMIGWELVTLTSHGRAILKREVR